MLFRFLGSILNSTVAYAYPAYASFKTLSKRPASEPELERWLMYWSVVGCIVSIEYIAEWTISWIPLYWLLKTTFLIWLALPQTQGATYIYQAHLEPLLTEYEPTIDQHLGQYKTRIWGFIQGQLRTLWAGVSEVIAKQTGINLNVVDPATANDQAQQPASGATGQGALMALNLWHTWGPSIINTLRPPVPQGQEQQPALAQQPRSSRQRPAAAPVQGYTVTSSKSSATLRGSDVDTIRARRREIEAELARLQALESEQQPEPHQSMYLSEAASASEQSLETERVRDSGRYEEIERDELDDELSDGGASANANRWSWWGRGGYTPVKQE